MGIERREPVRDIPRAGSGNFDRTYSRKGGHRARTARQELPESPGPCQGQVSRAASGDMQLEWNGPERGIPSNP